jgi:hypothetical protein
VPAHASRADTRRGQDTGRGVRRLIQPAPVQREVGRRDATGEGARAAKQRAQLHQPCQQADLRWDRADERVRS